MITEPQMVHRIHAQGALKGSPVEELPKDKHGNISCPHTRQVVYYSILYGEGKDEIAEKLKLLKGFKTDDGNWLVPKKKMKLAVKLGATPVNSKASS